MNSDDSTLQGICPHCGYQLMVPELQPGLDCPACDLRVIVRDGSFLSIDQAKDQVATQKANPEIEDEKPSPLNEVDLLIQQGNKIAALKLHRKITGSSLKEAKAYVDQRPTNKYGPASEYRRVCNNCGKVWHSLISRENQLISSQTSDALLACNTCDQGARAQYARNGQVKKDTLTELRRCPECLSTNYKETVLNHEK